MLHNDVDDDDDFDDGDDDDGDFDDGILIMTVMMVVSVNEV